MSHDTSTVGPGAAPAGARAAKVALGVGFAALLAGTLLAHRSPADGYELSIYEATPTAYWFGLAAALVASAGVAVFATDRRLLRNGAVLLAGTSIASLVLLPLIRGYYYFGAGDSLTHLGWMRDIVAGRLEPFGLLYPGIHTMGIFVARLLDVRLGLAQMYVVAAFVLAFVAFVALLVRLLGRTRLALLIGLFAGLLLLPNNNISVHLMAHPVTQSLLLVPLVLFLALIYARPSPDARFLGATPAGVLLSLVTVALVVIHPQGALNVILILATVSAVQLYFRRSDESTRIDDHRPLYVPTIVGVAAFALWAPRFDRVSGAALEVVTSLVGGAAPTGDIAQRSTSLTEIGGSILELFVKLFLPATVFALLTAALLYVLYTGRLADRDSDREALVTYVAASLVPVSVLFAFFFVANVSTQHFRYLGFVMVPVTVLGAVALDEGLGRVGGSSPDWTGRLALVGVLLLLLPLPLATVHASPFIYQPTSATPEAELTGYEATFEQMDRGIGFIGIRGGPNRQLDAIYGTERSDQMAVDGASSRGAIPYGVFGNNMTSHYNDTRYLPVTEGAYDREVRLYDGLRYPERGFEKLDATVGISQVHTNGGYQLYVVDGEEDE